MQTFSEEQEGERQQQKQQQEGGAAKGAGSDNESRRCVRCSLCGRSVAFVRTGLPLLRGIPPSPSTARRAWPARCAAVWSRASPTYGPAFLEWVMRMFPVGPRARARSGDGVTDARNGGIDSDARTPRLKTAEGSLLNPEALFHLGPRGERGGQHHPFRRKSSSLRAGGEGAGGGAKRRSHDGSDMATQKRKTKRGVSFVDDGADSTADNASAEQLRILARWRGARSDGRARLNRRRSKSSATSARYAAQRRRRNVSQRQGR